MNASFMKTNKKDLVFVMVCLCPLKIFCFSCFCAYDNRKLLFKFFLILVLCWYILNWIYSLGIDNVYVIFKTSIHPHVARVM